MQNPGDNGLHLAGQRDQRDQRPDDASGTTGEIIAARLRDVRRRENERAEPRAAGFSGIVSAAQFICLGSRSWFDGQPRDEPRAGCRLAGRFVFVFAFASVFVLVFVCAKLA